jgi:transcriptional regulator with XRE-family HTH domain
MGSRIAAARRSSGLTQRQLADALGTSTWMVERMESGAADTARYLSAIADVTRRPHPWFLRPSSPTIEPRISTRTGQQTHLGATGRNLVLGSIVLLVTIRFFTEVVPALPRAGNFVDIPIFLVLALAAMCTPAGPRPGRAYLHLGLPAAAFVLLALTSAIVNSRRTELAPVLVFIYGFLAPLAVYAAAYRIWPPGSARSLSRLLVGLGLLELAVVGLIDLPRFASSGNPDDISGTFGTNAYQLVFFLLVVASLLVGIFTLEPVRQVARFAPFLIFAIFAVILLAQYRAILATTVIVMVVVGVLLGGRARGVLAGVLAVVAFALVFSYVATSFPALKLEATATTLSQSPWSYASQRSEAARPVVGLYEDDPLASAIGSGPGTFSSRAWQTFALESMSASNVQGAYARRLTGGVVYKTDVSEKYVLPQLREGDIIEGSRAVSQPYSSYLALAAEVGLAGLALLAGIYLASLLWNGRIARREIAGATHADPVPALALATTVAFLMLVQMGFLQNWLEVTRVTFVVWAMFAVVSKERDSRSPVPA